jgi:hypothetical protein
VFSVVSWLCGVLPVIIAIRYGGDYTVWISSVRALLVSTDVIMILVMLPGDERFCSWCVGVGGLFYCLLFLICM